MDTMDDKVVKVAHVGYAVLIPLLLVVLYSILIL